MTLTTETGTIEPRRYGNLWERQSPGVWRLSLPASVAVGAGIIFALILMSRSLLSGFIVLSLTAIFAVPAITKNRWGQTYWQLLFSTFRFKVGERRGFTLYRAGLFSKNEKTSFHVPGLGSAIRLEEGRTPDGKPFVVVIHKTGEMAVVLSCPTPGTNMLPEHERDQLVGNWSACLAEFSFEPGLEGVAVHVESAYGSSSDLERSVADNLSANAPEISRRLAYEMAQELGHGAPRQHCHVTFTYAAAKSRTRKVKEAVRVEELGNRLPDLIHKLSAATGGPVTPVDKSALSLHIFRSFNPDKAQEVEQLLATEETLAWQDAGPVGASEGAKTYSHDDCRSISWTTGSAPKGTFYDSHIQKFTMPIRDIDVVRTTILYRPIPPELTDNEVDKLNHAASWQLGKDKVSKARNEVVAAAAQRSELEVAQGAALVRCGFIVTATQIGTDTKPVSTDELIQAVEGNLSPSSRVRLRIGTNQQSVLFIAGLPLGVILARQIANLNEWKERV